ncbi:hypothetical protein GCM10023196_091910 [Actinoallomurus vinaceus]|uniref:Phage holin family protein n=2 Tax=Actinoallomurus vinaceus TaxID=1080074 RepID=A0ABP8UQB3_9ACTN
MIRWAIGVHPGFVHGLSTGCPQPALVGDGARRYGDHGRDRPEMHCHRVPSAYARLMGRAILTIIGILLAIWLLFTVLGMLISALKFLLWLGVLAVIGAVIVTVISKMAKS